MCSDMVDFYRCFLFLPYLDFKHLIFDMHISTVCVHKNLQNKGIFYLFLLDRVNDFNFFKMLKIFFIGSYQRCFLSKWNQGGLHSRPYSFLSSLTSRCQATGSLTLFIPPEAAIFSIKR